MNIGQIIDKAGGMGTVSAAVSIGRIYMEHDNIPINEAALEGARWADIEEHDLLAVKRELSA